MKIVFTNIKNLLLVIMLILCMQQGLYAQESKLWGMTTGGGANGYGIIFQYDPLTNVYTTVHSFTSADGTGPWSDLALASDGKLYGMTPVGGANNAGVIFQVDPQTNSYTDEFDFTDGSGSGTGNRPYGALIQETCGQLYGMTAYGGDIYYDGGTLFQYIPGSNNITVPYQFDNYTGDEPRGSLIQASDGYLYGMTWTSNTGSGIIFRCNLDGTGYTVEYTFPGGLLVNAPWGSLIEVNGFLYGMSPGLQNYGGLIFKLQLSNYNFTPVHNFNNASGWHPYGSLIQACDGKLYGLTYQGGAHGNGVIFQFDPVSTTYLDAYDFVGNTGSGASPWGSLIQASAYSLPGDCKLYGMTLYGGANDLGVIFEYDPVTNVYTDKIEFTGVGGSYPGGNPHGSLTEIYDVNTSQICPLSYCGGNAVSISYSIANNVTFNGDNVFTAQLSNASGFFGDENDVNEFSHSNYTFDYPINIGSVNSTNSGTINATIPANTLAGTGYRIRVVSSDPKTEARTNNNGADISISGNCTATPLCTLQVSVFIQGYYIANSTMEPVLSNEGVVTNNPSTDVDYVTIVLVDPNNGTHVVASQGILQTNGSLTVTFPSYVCGNSYYIYIQHRNSLETSSANPVLMTGLATYSFSSSASKAFGNNEVDVGGVWAIYSGDIDQDGYIDPFDYPPFNFDNSALFLGYEDCSGFSADLNGDGGVGPSDFPLLDNNISLQVTANLPW